MLAIISVRDLRSKISLLSKCSLSKWSLWSSLAPFIYDFFPLPIEFWEWHFSRKLFFFFFPSHDMFYHLILNSDWWLITVQWNLMGSMDSQTLKSSLKCDSSNCFWSLRLKTAAQLWQTLQVGPNRHPPQSFLLLEVVKWPIFSQWNRRLLRGEGMGTLCSFGKMRWQALPWMRTQWSEVL